MLLIATVTSCKKKDNQPGVIPHIKGRLVEHCNRMKPMAIKHELVCSVMQASIATNKQVLNLARLPVGNYLLVLTA